MASGNIFPNFSELFLNKTVFFRLRITEILTNKPKEIKKTINNIIMLLTPLNSSFKKVCSRFSLSRVVALGMMLNLSIVPCGQAKDNRSNLLAQESDSPLKSRLADGIYLYGHSAKREEIGEEYLVFKLKQGKIRGAIYFPQSEFSCFSATLNNLQMNLTIIDPSDGSKYPYSLDWQTTAPVASNQEFSEVVLNGYYRLKNISDKEHRLLQTCLKNQG